MSSTTPTLPLEIQKKLNTALQNIAAHVDENHIDGVVNLSGYLNSMLGAKVQISNLEQFGMNDIDDWLAMCYKSGACDTSYTADLSTGRVTIDVEYKRPSSPIKYCEWLKYPLILVSLGAILQFL